MMTLVELLAGVLYGYQCVETIGSFQDGGFFLNLVDGVELRLKQKCTKTEQDLLVNTSEEGLDPATSSFSLYCAFVTFATGNVVV